MRQKGQSVVELLVAMAVAGFVLPALLTGMVASREGKAQQRQRLAAVTLMKEAQEASRVVREAGWDGFATNGTFHPVPSSTNWTLVAGAETVNGYTRSVVIADVRRDAAGAIVSSGGTIDPSTKRVNVTVSWGTPFASSVTSDAYVTRYMDNLTFTQSSQAEFDAGTKTGVVTTNVSGGEVQLAPGGKGEWCNPNLSITALDLPKNGVANAISAIPGRVVAGTGENASGVSFADINVADTNPPTSSITGTADGYKTNAVFVSGTYAYLATDDNNKEVVILDLTQLDPDTQKYAEVGYFDASGTANAVSVAVSGNVGFVTTGSTLRTFNLTAKTGSRAQLASRALAGNGTKIVINGNYAFISIAGAAQELQIVQFNAAGTTLTITGWADVNGEAAYDVSVNSSGSRAYIATGASASLPEFFIINTSSKNGNRPSVGSYNSNGMDPNAVAVVTGNKAILVGTDAEEYQVIDISSESSPVRCGGMEIDTGVNGVASVLEADGDAYSYIITGDASTELKIIEGGPGGSFATDGVFESATIDVGFQTAFNRYQANETKPTGTDITYQFAVVDAVSGSCTGVAFTFVGPDGTNGTQFATSSGAIPMDDDASGYENPGRCARFKAFMSTTDDYASPILNEMIINYSP